MGKEVNFGILDREWYTRLRTVLTQDHSLACILADRQDLAMLAALKHASYHRYGLCAFGNFLWLEDFYNFCYEGPHLDGGDP